MRWFLIISVLLSSLILPQRSQGQTVPVNTDYKTIAGMEANVVAQKKAESEIVEDYKLISKHYKSAEVAMSGIYLLKKSDRKALEDARMMASEEFYYYRLAYMYAGMIMKKVLNLTTVLAENPEDVLQWGPYIYDVVTKTKDHCKQFSAMVMNGKVTFKGVAGELGWLVFGDEIIEVFNLMRLANYDWQGMIDTFSGDFDDITKDITIDDIGDLFNFVYDKGKDFAENDLATAGKDIMDDMLGAADRNQSSGGDKNKKKSIKEKAKAIKNTVETIMDIYDVIKDPQQVKAMFLEKLGLSEPLDPKEVLKKIFKSEDGELDISGYVNNYNTPDSAQFYTQMWHIVRKVESSVMVDWSPTDVASCKSSQWVTLPNYPTDHSLLLTPGDKEVVLQNSERCAKISRSTVDQMNSEIVVGGYYRYVFRSDLCTAMVPNTNTSSLNSMVWVAAYHIKVIREPKGNGKVYSARLDSRIQDPYVFEANMNQYLRDKQSQDPNSTYIIEKDEPQYYEAADTLKLRNCESVSYIARCNDGGDMSSGDFFWKVNPKFPYGNLNSTEAREKAIEYAMQEGVDPSVLDTEEVDARIKAAQDSITDLNALRKELKAEEAVIAQKINDAQSNMGNLKELGDQLNEVRNRISKVDNELSTVQSNLQGYQEARSEIIKDYQEQDKGNRIPSKENELAQLFRLEWITPKGSWNGLTYTHKARMQNTGDTDYTITFKAKLSMIKSEVKFLGIRIHRAQLKVEWNLSGHVESENTVYVLPLDSTWSKEKKEAMVNERLSAEMANYPDCTISMEYNKTETDQTEDVDAIHLLWPHERLALARDLTSRLINIYARLMEVEKYIYYTKSMDQWIKGKLKCPMRPPKRGNKADSCYREWINRAERNVKSNQKGI